jgi:tetratricopeptide (TPR) repeat protein/predicted Ser/Thr protein kinase
VSDSTDPTVVPHPTPVTAGGKLPPGTPAVDPSERYGKFVRTAKLGGGGEGDVWKAWDGELQRWVALKFLRGGDDEEIARFKREAQTAASLAHPHIAAVYEAGEAQGRHYIAMQFVEGRTLRAMPRGDRRLLARLLRDASLAVQAAHDGGVIHRDLKPDNVMASERAGGPHVYVMDFGLARSAAPGDASVSGAIVGTPAYMSPEQARGESADARSDVYGLGATLYEVLTGVRPFESKSVLETLRRVQSEELRPPRSVEGRIDRDLETIVLKCLEKERDRRYARAGDLAADLTRWLDGEPIHARPAGFFYLLRRRLAKRKAIVAVALAGVVAVGATLGVLVPRWLAERERARIEARRNEEAQQRQAAMLELNRLWTGVVTIREWTRQKFRRPADIREALRASVEELDGFVRAHESMALGWTVRGRTKYWLGDLAGAERDALKAAALEPGFSPAWGLLVQLRADRWSWATSTPYPKGREEAGRIAHAALVEAARHWEGKPAADWGLSRTNEDAMAEEIVTAIRAMIGSSDPGVATAAVAEAHRRTASEDACLLLSRIGEEKRKEWLEAALRIAPHCAPAWFGRALTRKNPRDAIEDLAHAIDIWPAFAEALALRGIAWASLGETDRAEADFRAALAESPPDWPARNCVQIALNGLRK